MARITAPGTTKYLPLSILLTEFFLVTLADLHSSFGIPKINGRFLVTDCTERA
jgi:hypothetical protein